MIESKYQLMDFYLPQMHLSNWGSAKISKQSRAPKTNLWLSNFCADMLIRKVDFCGAHPSSLASRFVTAHPRNTAKHSAGKLRSRWERDSAKRFHGVLLALGSPCQVSTFGANERLSGSQGDALVAILSVAQSFWLWSTAKLLAKNWSRSM